MSIKNKTNIFNKVYYTLLPLHYYDNQINLNPIINTGLL